MRLEEAARVVCSEHFRGDIPIGYLFFVELLRANGTTQSLCHVVNKCVVIYVLSSVNYYTENKRSRNSTNVPHAEVLFRTFYYETD